MQHVYFITGYPGFLASGLIRQLIKDYREQVKHIYLLVLPEEMNRAKEDIFHFQKAYQLDQDFTTIIPGDITKKQLAMNEGTLAKVNNQVTHVFHLAALYDLAVPKELAHLTNVLGTKQVNQWVQTLPSLKRYVYFSTAYVSGTRKGKIYEHELKKKQSFRNHYEHTKYLAEISVRKVMNIVPTTIIRASIVIGNSQTGFIPKFDGLYFLLNFYDKIHFPSLIPYFGDSQVKVEGNFVPSDFVLQATSFLVMQEESIEKTYHLTNPNPYTMRDIQTMIAEDFLGKRPKRNIPIPLTKALLQEKMISKWIKVEKEAMDYFTIPSSYDCSETLKDLSGTGITCPDLKNVLPPMVDFYRKYKDDHQKQIDVFRQ